MLSWLKVVAGDGQKVCLWDSSKPIMFTVVKTRDVIRSQEKSMLDHRATGHFARSNLSWSDSSICWGAPPAQPPNVVAPTARSKNGRLGYGLRLGCCAVAHMLCDFQEIAPTGPAHIQNVSHVPVSSAY